MKYLIIIVIAAATLCLFSCSASKTGTDLKASRNNMKGTWQITDIQTNLPAGFSVTNVFDAGPWSDFENSTWDLVRNGKGTYTLSNGTTQKIYWSTTGSGGQGTFQFKKLDDGEKAANVKEGYVLNLQDLSRDRFTAVSNVKLAEGKMGTITYTFERK